MRPSTVLQESWRRRISASWWWLVLAVLVVLFWKLRVIDAASVAGIRAHSVDLYIEHIPMVEYAARVLHGGSLPLWNPYQFAGMPFLAIPHTGLFYPLNFVYLLFDAAIATEISLVLHLILQALGMAMLVRALGLSRTAATAAAMTFTWSGWIFYQINVPAPIACQSWLPLTVLAVELSLRGSRVAPFGLVFAVAMQTLSGAPEYVLYNMYCAAAFTVFRMADRAAAAGLARTLRDASVLSLAILAGVSLASVQLLPSFELAAQSSRVPLTLAKALAVGPYMQNSIPGPEFFREILTVSGIASVGFLPFLGVWLGFLDRSRRNLWAFAIFAVVVSALLVFGGAVFELYHLTLPGRMFRRPIKFLQIYTFAQALLAALAVAQLQLRPSRGSNAEQVARPVSSPRLAALGALTAALLGLGVYQGLVSGWWFAALVGISLSIAGSSRLSIAALAVVVFSQASSLFLGGHNDEVRPAAQPGVFDEWETLLNTVAQRAGSQRVYLDGEFLAIPGLTMKQGTLRNMRAVVDYQPLAIGRYASFFRFAAREPHPRDPFAGDYHLGPRTRFKLMDLTSTRYYIVQPHKQLDLFLSSEPTGFRLVGANAGARVYERQRALPRAYVVEAARRIDDPKRVLAGLASPQFDPRREVLLESAIASEDPPHDSSAGRSKAEIVVDAPERVVVEFETSRSGYLVLTDAAYPGWSARVNGEEVAIQRANYLFRAVRVPKGKGRVEFVFEPDSVRHGLRISALTFLLICGAALWVWTRRPAMAG